MDTHLVVDASGRHSRLPQWLSDEGFTVPPVETVNSKLGYATRMYHIPEWNKVTRLHVQLNGQKTWSICKAQCRYDLLLQLR